MLQGIITDSVAKASIWEEVSAKATNLKHMRPVSEFIGTANFSKPADLQEVFKRLFTFTRVF